MPKEVNTLNKFAVSVTGHGQVYLMGNPSGILNKEDALNLAAYLVVLVGDDERFAEVLQAVKNT
jgi:hypothetical protein